MTNSCHGKCSQYRSKRIITGGNRYLGTGKRCQICDIFIEYEGRFCPCCNARLRFRPRHKSKNLLQSCDFCGNYISLWGKIVHFFTFGKKKMCVLCYDEKYPIKSCSACGIKTSFDEKGRIHWYRPSLGLNLCRDCYNDRRYVLYGKKTLLNLRVNKK
jgi:hypothetical protein